MNHEPECLATYDPSPFFHKPTEPYCSCEAIRVAYQRGREDAAKAVEQLRIGSFGIVVGEKYYESILDTKEAIAAARGDGEQEQAFQELIQLSQELGLYENGEQA